MIPSSATSLTKFALRYVWTFQHVSQAAWRRRWGVRMARALLASVVSKVLDEDSGEHYYFNSLTGETSWSKPALFGSEVKYNTKLETSFNPSLHGRETWSDGHAVHSLYQQNATPFLVGRISSAVDCDTNKNRRS